MADRGSHARHDRFEIADAIGGGMMPATIGSCPPCGALHADLAAIRLALQASWLPSRPRDLQLTAADAARLRPAPWRRLMATIGTSRDVITRPLAAAFTGLGLAGLLLTSVPVDALGGVDSAEAGANGAAPGRVYVTGVPPPPIAADHRLPDPPATVRLTGLSIGLLVAGGAVFVARRIAPRIGRVR